MSTLQQLITDLIDDSSPLSNSLRQLLAFGYRAKSASLQNWVLGELQGYRKNSDIPNYRRDVPHSYSMYYIGVGGYRHHTFVQPSDIPNELRLDESNLKTVRNSITELESLIHSKTELGIELSKAWVGEHVRLFSEGKAPGYAHMTLDRAVVRYPQNGLIQILSMTRTEALKLALELEQISPEILSSKSTSNVELEKGRQTAEIAIEQMLGNVTLIQGGSHKNIGREIHDNHSEQTNVNVGDSMNIQGDNAATSGLFPETGHTAG
ncbi:hypothetical protein M5J06_09135 [Corynebacterium sp. B5-R-101]|uniref:AbiTii domain-containing protein n=1 Tax=Corynebacterium intestinale TaxID=2943492 RepID=A0ABT0TBG8_9CORY|nr:hypothetical protein [Corynebacterium intestinale]MCP1390522.1 hypothetical protein [Corynebacterium intestinale]